MELLSLLLLLISYTKVNQFEALHYGQGDPIHVVWFCKNDETKTVALNADSVRMETIDEVWEIRVSDDFIACYHSTRQNEANQFGGSVSIYSQFGDEFEKWFARTFEEINCAPAQTERLFDYSALYGET